MYKRIVWGMLGCLALLITAGSIAIAQIETTPIPPNPKPDFSSMSFLVGTWNCTEQNTRRAKPYTYTTTNTMDPTGYWMDSKTVNHASPWARESISLTKQTYDASTSRWLTLMTDNQGNYDFSTSKGWNGNKIVWHDESYPKTNNTSTSGDTIVTKVSPTKTTYTSSFGEPSGRTVQVKGTCTKSS